MGLLDGPMRSVASTLLSTLGATATLSRILASYDPSMDEQSEDTTSQVVDISPPEPFHESRIDGSTILSTDLRCLVAAKALDDAAFVVDPASNARFELVYDGRTYEVVAQNHLRSGDQVAAIELHLR